MANNNEYSWGGLADSFMKGLNSVGTGLGTGLGTAGTWLNTDAGSSVLQAGLGFAGDLMSNDIQKQMADQEAAYKKELLAMQQKTMDIAEADRLRNIQRQEEQEKGLAEGFLRGMSSKEDQVV